MKNPIPGRMVMALAVIALALPAIAADDKPAGEPKSLRGDTPVESTSNIDLYRWEKDTGAPIPRDFVQQPPLIPHTIKGYQITKNFNKCMDCHSWSRAPETKATKISLTHFKDRDGKELSNVSPRRYFCLQCHVPQTDAAPLVKNDFKPVEGVAPKK
jgi:nitrate reductase (cytochrome), electron transfer subunit